MPEPLIYRVIEEAGTKFVVLKQNEGGYTHFLNASGRLNFTRPIQSYDAFMLNTGSYLTILRHVLRGGDSPWSKRVISTFSARLKTAGASNTSGARFE